MTTRITTQLLAAAALLGLSATAQAVVVPPSIYVLPSNASVSLNEGTATLEVFMDFTGAPTIGGGIDIALSGPVSLVSFTPSTFLLTVPDQALSGFGPDFADADLEIHLGSFSGLSGFNKLGDLTLGLTGLGLAEVSLSINSIFGDFFALVPINAPLSKLDVNLSGAKLQVVPVPAAAWLFVSALGALGGMRLRRAA